MLEIHRRGLCVDRDDQPAAVDGHVGGTEHRIVVEPGVGLEVVTRTFAHGPGLHDAILDPGSRDGRRRDERQHRRHRVCRDAEELVDHPAGHRKRRDRAAVVGEDDDAELLGGDHHQLGRHPVDSAGMFHRLPAGMVVEEPAQSVAEKIGARVEEVHPASRCDRHLHLEHFGVGGRSQERPAVDGAAVQVKPDPLRHVEHVRVDRAGGANVVDLPVSDRNEFPVDGGVRRCDVGEFVEAADRGVRTGHAEWLEDPLLDEIVPGCAGGGGDRLAGGQEHDVLIAEGGSEAPGRLVVPDPPDHLGATVVAAHPEEIAAGETASVRDQVADGEFPGHRRVVEFESLHHVRHPGVPAEPALIDQHAEGRRGERLGGRPDGKERPGRHRRGLAECPYPEAPGVHDRIVLDHRDGQSDPVELLQRILDVAVEAGNRVRGGALGLGGAGREREGQECGGQGTHGISGRARGTVSPNLIPGPARRNPNPTATAPGESGAPPARRRKSSGLRSAR